MKMRLAIAAAVASLALAALAPMTGCEAIQDGIATVSGAPTSKEFKELQAKIVEAEQQRDLATEARDALAHQESAELQRQAQIEAQREALEAQYAAMAAQLVTLTGEARRALVDAMDAVRRRVDAVSDMARQQAEIVAQYQAEIARADKDLAKLSDSITTAESNFEALKDQRDEAFGGLTTAVNAIGTIAVAAGVPQEAVDRGTGVILTGLGVAVGSAPTGVLAWWERRKKKQAKAESEARGKIIQTTERYGLLEHADPNAKRAAKSELTPEAALELQKLTTNVQKLKSVPALSQGAPSAA